LLGKTPSQPSMVEAQRMSCHVHNFRLIIILDYSTTLLQYTYYCTKDENPPPFPAYTSFATFPCSVPKRLSKDSANFFTPSASSS